MDDAPEMAPQTTFIANAGDDSQNLEEMQQLLQPPPHPAQVVGCFCRKRGDNTIFWFVGVIPSWYVVRYDLAGHLPSVPPTSRKSTKKKARRRKREESGTQSVADSKYSTNSPSSSTVNDEIFVPLTDSKSSAAMELTILETSPADAADIPTVLVQPPSSTPSVTACRDEQILEALREIVRNCTVQDPEKRASAAEVHAALSKLL
ncbi:uncharacterized protein LOC144146033 isoform X1 [Haemaphysalis longicornis]